MKYVQTSAIKVIKKMTASIHEVKITAVETVAKQQQILTNNSHQSIFSV